MSIRPPSEAAFMRTVLAYARLRGWTVAHFRPAKTAHGWRTAVQGDGAGFPDLVLVRGPRLLFVELKTDLGRLTDAQQRWLNRLLTAEQIALIWRPSDWSAIEKCLE